MHARKFFLFCGARVTLFKYPNQHLKEMLIYSPLCKKELITSYEIRVSNFLFGQVSKILGILNRLSK